MERMVAISLINLAMRMFIVLGIFLLVHKPGDYLLYAGLMSAGSMAAGVAGLAVAVAMFGLKPANLSWKGIWETLVEGWTVFLSKASVSLYAAGNAFILGMLTNHTVVGYYSAAEKIVRSVVGLIGPISQAAYPRFSKMAAESRALALQWAQRMLMLMGGFGLVLSIALFTGAPLTVSVVLGHLYEPSISVMRILAPLPLLIAVSNVLGIQIMLPFGKDKSFTKILFSAGIINIIFAILFGPTWQESGMAIAALLSELFVTATMLVYVYLHDINPLTVRLRGSH